MTFDAGTWWLITIIVTTVVGLVGFLFGRSVFRQLDENRADIKQVRENYTPRDDHQKDLERLRTAHQKDVEALRREMKEMRTEMRTEIRQMSDDVKDIKENCIRREEFVSHQLKLENKLEHMSRKTTRDKLLSYLSQQAVACGGRDFDIPHSRQELARYLGVDRSAMSNELSKMKTEGLLEFQRNHFVLYEKAGAVNGQT